MKRGIKLIASILIMLVYCGILEKITFSLIHLNFEVGVLGNLLIYSIYVLVSILAMIDLYNIFKSFGYKESWEKRKYKNIFNSLFFIKDFLLLNNISILFIAMFKLEKRQKEFWTFVIIGLVLLAIVLIIERIAIGYLNKYEKLESVEDPIITIKFP